MPSTVAEKPLPRTENRTSKKFYFFEFAVPVYSIDTPRYFLGGVHPQIFREVYADLRDPYSGWNLLSIDEQGIIRLEDAYPPESVEFFCIKEEFRDLVKKGWEKHLLSYLFTVVEIPRT